MEVMGQFRFKRRESSRVPSTGGLQTPSVLIVQEKILYIFTCYRTRIPVARQSINNIPIILFHLLCYNCVMYTNDKALIQ